MRTIGDTFPAFTAKAVVSNQPGKQFIDVDGGSFEGKWKVYFLWPKDFTFVCPTEIAAFGKLEGDFRDRDAQLLGVSVDSEFVHLAWRADHDDLRDRPFPMVSDLRRELTTGCGVLDRKDGVAMRATFIVDPQGEIRFVEVTDMNVGRNPAEVLRVLDGVLPGAALPRGWPRVPGAAGAAAHAGDRQSRVDHVDFELWCLAASAVTGCGAGVVAHERVLRGKGVTAPMVQDAVRIAAIVHALAVTLEGVDARA